MASRRARSTTLLQRTGDCLRPTGRGRLPCRAEEEQSVAIGRRSAAGESRLASSLPALNPISASGRLSALLRRSCSIVRKLRRRQNLSLRGVPPPQADKERVHEDKCSSVCRGDVLSPRVPCGPDVGAGSAADGATGRRPIRPQELLANRRGVEDAAVVPELVQAAGNPEL